MHSPSHRPQGQNPATPAHTEPQEPPAVTAFSHPDGDEVRSAPPAPGPSSLPTFSAP